MLEIVSSTYLKNYIFAKEFQFLFYKIVLCYIKDARYIILNQNTKILPLVLII